MDQEYNYKPLKKPISLKEQFWAEGTKPLVHTRTMTYMHERFIRECIEGILMQKTTFPVQVLIHDDASTDETVNILQEYELKYPKLIKVFYQKENSYSKSDKNLRRAEFNKWRIGKYEAMCEGDDYWIDPLKLQKQIDFLEKNPDYVLTSHSRIIVNENSERLRNTDSLAKDYGTQCIVYKYLLKKDIHDFNTTGIVNGDTFLLTYLRNFGKMKILDFVGSAYRKTDSGVWAKYDYRKKFELALHSFTKMECFFTKNNYLKSVKLTKMMMIRRMCVFAIDLKSDNYRKEAYKYYFKILGQVLKNLNNPYIYRPSFFITILTFPFK